ncbi:MAG: molybdenum ABC transporter substrate-binding protein [Deltaproteobacteria bacterium SG8_13]|nr:MAG: molybdenum ABC transporter substrate-binding protein [Deltaproteobacteria bacterium SG8_13]
MEKKNLPMIPAERIEDLHNLEVAETADLVLFMAGNQFMVMDELLRAFKQDHPEVEKIFYETLPPGLELKQILAGGAIFGETILDVYPDIYTAVNEQGMHTLIDTGHIYKNNYQLYLHNRLALMVPEGNPAGIEKIGDLGRDEVRISQPDPANEHIAFHIIDMYRQAGGERLVRRIMEEKRAGGTTILTLVHHRETPLRIAKKTVDVGPVWATEAIHARTTGLKFDVIEPGEDLDQRERIDYYVCKLKKAPHPESANAFYNFILSPTAQKIFERYGFVSQPQ